MAGRKKIYLIALLSVLALCFSMTACGGKQQESADPVTEGEEYRDFTAALADGSTFTLSDHEGSVILLNFWATWCGPCVGELPAFPRLLETYGDDLTLIAVDLGEKEDTVKSFLERNGYDFPVALDEEGDIGSLYPSDGIPYTVLIGRDGKIAYIHLGADSADVMYEEYSAEIDTLLEEAAP
ncbi:MAG: TlpA family protein disulfide reductase [Firmicutes bacterium]|nr:TlpA family protein disulfide reductase [Bacillota bacterium]